MSNNTPPKEIYLGNEFIEIIEGKMRSREFASTEMIYNEQIKYLSEESVNEMLAEKDKEIPKWIPVTTKPEFDGDYLCLVMETEQCGATYTKQRVLCNSFNTWMTLSNQSVLFWMPLPKQP